MTHEQRVESAAPVPASGDAPDSFSGHVKWFDATRGFGFVVDDAYDGDILVHFSVLKPHNRRSLPEGASISGYLEQQDRGLQAVEITDIDLSTALPVEPRPARSSAQKADRTGLEDKAGPYEGVEVKWFNRVRGYGFVNRVNGDEVAEEDIFLHMETVRDGQMGELEPGQRIEARIAESDKGLTAVAVRAPE